MSVETDHEIRPEIENVPSNINQRPQVYSEGTTDDIPSVHPVVDRHDTLWAQTEVLDNIAEMTDKAWENHSFYGEKHGKALQELRQAQVELAQVMSTGNSSQIKGSSTARVMWTGEDFETLRNKLFDKEKFTVISKHVAATVDKLDLVERRLREFEEEDHHDD